MHIMDDNLRSKNQGTTLRPSLSVSSQDQTPDNVSLFVGDAIKPYLTYLPTYDNHETMHTNCIEG